MSAYSDEQLRVISDALDAGKDIKDIVVPPGKKKRFKNNNEESRSQKMLIKWWSHRCKDYDIPEQLLFAIPNGMAFGGKAEWQVRTSIIRGRNAKLEGLRPGFCDLMLAVPVTQVLSTKMIPSSIETFHGLFLEMKTAKGVVPPEQTLIHSLLSARGYKVVVVRSTESAINEIEDYLS